MACSGCKERREALMRAARAAGRGNARQVGAELGDVARSAARDAGKALRLAAAHARLKRR
jgi:hypothetical protein